MLTRSFLSVCLIATFLSSTSLSAADDEKGSATKPDAVPAMDFQNLVDVSGKKTSLSDYKQEFVVVCFTSNTCPYSLDYEQRMKDLQAEFQKAKTSAILVAINSNDHKDDTLEEMQERASSQKFNFDYLKDEDQEVARLFDAIYTPEFFVLNQRREVVYRGAMDDATSIKVVKHNYVQEAIDAITIGKTPEVKETGARGCRIRYQRRRRR